MNYTELIFKINPINSWTADILSSMLAKIGFESFSNIENGLLAYIPSKNFIKGSIDEIASNELFNDINIQYESKVIQDKNWNEVWESNFDPVIVLDKCIVKAPFHKIEKSYEYEIHIEPKMSFGTGHHETTSLIIEYILDIDFSDKKVLDMGCGTAILAILTSMKGAKHITAIDNDEWAFNNSLENVERNNINNIEVFLGDANLLEDKKYDIIIANINRNILLNDIGKYSECLHSGTTLILSGIYKTDVDTITNECNKHGLYYLSMKEKNKWVAVRFEKR